MLCVSPCCRPSLRRCLRCGLYGKSMGTCGKLRTPALHTYPTLSSPPALFILCRCFGKTPLFPAISMGETLGLLGKLLCGTILHQKIVILSSLFVREGEDCVISIGERCG